MADEFQFSLTCVPFGTSASGAGSLPVAPTASSELKKKPTGKVATSKQLLPVVPPRLYRDGTAGSLRAREAIRSRTSAGTWSSLS